MLLNPFKFYTPKTIADAIELYSKLENVKLKAGGTFLINNLKSLKRKGGKTPDNIISLSKIKELKGIQIKNNILNIKSMTTISDLINSRLINDKFNIIKNVAENIGSTPIRNMATIGGNLTCRYTWTEFPALLIALDAKLHFIGKNSKEETTSAEIFFKNGAKTDKILANISIKKDKKSLVVYHRVKKSSHIDIPLLAICIKTNLDKNKFTNTIVSINNSISFPKRDSILESFLNKTTLSSKTHEEALNHLDNKIYDARSDDYKKHIFRISIKNSIKNLAELNKKN